MEDISGIGSVHNVTHIIYANTMESLLFGLIMYYRIARKQIWSFEKRLTDFAKMAKDKTMRMLRYVGFLSITDGLVLLLFSQSL